MQGGGCVSYEMTLRHVRRRALNIYRLESTATSRPEKHTRFVTHTLFIVKNTLLPLTKILNSLNDCLIYPGSELMVSFN